MTQPTRDSEIMYYMRQYCGRDPHAIGYVKEEVLNECSGEWPLAKFIEVIQEAIATIPEGLRTTAVVHLDGYSEGEASLAIWYIRSERDDEVAARVANARAYAEDKLEAERRHYEQLKAKFG